MWVPGLFWLFPFWLIISVISEARGNYQEPPSESFIKFYTFYSAVQSFIIALFLGIWISS
jgi:hypothetical protein